MAGSIKPDELRLYRLIWQRALASQMAPKELETTTIELADGPYELRASATKVLFDGFARVYTEGRDDEADRRRRGDRPPARRSPTAIGRRVEDVTPTQHFTEPPPRFTEATLIKALEEHGIGRPSTYAATISTITDRGYVRVEERRLHPELGRRDRDRPAGRALRRLRRRRVHGPDGGGARRGRPRRARRGCRCCAAFYGPLRDRVDEKRRRAQAQRLHDRGDRRGLLARPPDGHPARAQRPRSWPARCTPSTRRPGRCPGDEPPPQEGTGEVCPKCGEGTLVGKTRPVRAVRRLLALSRLRLHQEGRPAAARSAAVRGHLPQEQGRPPRPASRAADRERLLGVLELPALRLHDEPRAARRRCTTPTTGPLARKDEAAICLICGSTSDTPADDDRPGRARTPAARRTPRRSPGRHAPAAARAAGGASQGRWTSAWRTRRRADHAPSARAQSSRPPTRERASRPAARPILPSPGSSAPSPRVTPRRTPSAPTRRRSAPTSTGSPRVARTGERPARADLRAYLGRPRRRACPIVGRAAAGGDPRVPSLGDARRPRPGRPVGRDRHATPAAPAAARPRGRAGRAAARRHRRGPRRRAGRRPRAGGRVGSPWRCAIGRWSRPPTPPGCGSASWPRPSSGRSTCGAARSGSSARAARSASGCSAARRGRRSRPTSRTAARSSSVAARATSRHRSRSS